MKKYFPWQQPGMALTFSSGLSSVLKITLTSFSDNCGRETPCMTDSPVSALEICIPHRKAKLRKEGS